jgi:hypothetical protein
LDRKLAGQVAFPGLRPHCRDQAGVTINEGAAACEREWNDGAGLHGAEDHARSWLFDGQSRPPCTSLVTVYARLITCRTPRTPERRRFGLVRDACATCVIAARTFDQAERRKLLHLQIIKGLGLVDEDFRLLPQPHLSA